MSELKAHRIVGLDGRCNRVDNNYYLKSEADKVIAKLESEITQLSKQSSCKFSDDCLRVRQLKRELRRQKYKRCLKNAEGCLYKVWYYGEVNYRNGSNRMWKWRDRWMELAEKFKDKEAK